MTPNCELSECCIKGPHIHVTGTFDGHVRDAELAEAVRERDIAKHAFNMLQHDYASWERVHNLEMARLAKDRDTQESMLAEAERLLGAYCSYNAGYASSLVAGWLERRKAKP